MPIGVFDSGVGGLTVFRALEKALPAHPLIYLGDTARVPYGPRSADTVRRYSIEAGRFLKRQGVEMLVVACNTASAVAIPTLQEDLDLPVMGVIEPGAQRAVEVSKSSKIGVIGTRQTIASDAYGEAIRKEAADATIVAQACPLFVPLAEEGWVDDDIARGVAERYLQPLIDAEVDTLVLGCTHYPLLRGVIGQTMGWDVTLVDSAEAVALEVCRSLDATPGAGSGKNNRRFFVTDIPAPFRAVAERFLGRPLDRLERARIDQPNLV
jgi:glutamate racemase